MPIQPKQQPPYYETLAQSKIYKLIANQTGTNPPTVTITPDIPNIIWTRDSAGFYIGTKTGAFPQGTYGIASSSPSNGTIASITRLTDDQIGIEVCYAMDGIYDDSLLTDTYIQLIIP